MGTLCSITLLFHQRSAQAGLACAVLLLFLHFIVLFWFFAYIIIISFLLSSYLFVALFLSFKFGLFINSVFIPFQTFKASISLLF